MLLIKRIWPSTGICLNLTHLTRVNFDLTTFHYLGRHNALNALAATGPQRLQSALICKAIKSGLECFASQHLAAYNYIRLANGVKIIDDTYNANPFSLQAAVDTLSRFCWQKNISWLGDMRELGSEAKTLHHDAGQRIRQAGIDYLFTYGELSSNAAQAFGEGAYHFNEQDKLVTALKPFLFNQTTILVKGSRSMRMEKVIAGLVQ